MIVNEIHVKSILSRSKIYDYVVNPYGGCQHACSYCYARFMKRFSGHQEPWGEYIDVKINAPELLAKEITRKKPGQVWVSGVCDPYQPVEAKYKLTRGCLEILIQHDWPVTIQTRSPLVLRDLDIIQKGKDVTAGMSITTADERIRKLFEPHAPPIMKRIQALDELHQAGIRTFAMLAPLLPGAEGLVPLLKGKVNYIMVDRLNYRYADWVYKKYDLTDKLKPEFFYQTGEAIASACKEQGLDCRVIF
jgi:DNA repair photolyase